MGRYHYILRSILAAILISVFLLVAPAQENTSREWQTEAKSLIAHLKTSARPGTEYWTRVGKIGHLVDDAAYAELSRLTVTTLEQEIALMARDHVQHPEKVKELRGWYGRFWTAVNPILVKETLAKMRQAGKPEEENKAVERVLHPPVIRPGLVGPMGLISIYLTEEYRCAWQHGFLTKELARADAAVVKLNHGNSVKLYPLKASFYATNAGQGEDKNIGYKGWFEEMLTQLDTFEGPEKLAVMVEVLQIAEKAGLAAATSGDMLNYDSVSKNPREFGLKKVPSREWMADRLSLRGFLVQGLWCSRSTGLWPAERPVINDRWRHYKQLIETALANKELSQGHREFYEAALHRMPADKKRQLPKNTLRQ